MVLSNNGTCPIEDLLLLTHSDGEDFSYDGSTAFEVVLVPGQETTLVLDLRAPDNEGRHESTWQFETSDRTPIGPSMPFHILAYLPQTPTPPPTNTPEVPPTPTEPFGVNVFVDAASCAYEDTNWVCNLIVQPFGGIGPYTFVSDENPPADFSGAGPFVYQLIRPRCRPWNQTVTVSDSGTGRYQEALFFSPDPYFNPCTTAPG